MAEGLVSAQWNHTSAILAMLANINRDPKKGRPLTPADFHPIQGRKKQEPVVLKGDIRLLKTVFVDQQCPSTNTSS